MTETEKERHAVKPTKSFDESKLTAPQREALAVAKAQGKPFNRSLADLRGDLEPEAVDEMLETVMEMRRLGRVAPRKNPLD